MAFGKKTGGKDFSPGENFYQKTVPSDLRQARKLSKIEIELILTKYLHMPLGELMAMMKDPMLPTIEVLVMSILVSAIKKGDQFRLDFVLDRLIGKVKNEVDLTVSKSFHEQVVDLIDSVEAEFEKLD